jgi:hypothetical protein
MENILNQEVEWMAFRSRVKWREEGEKSTKYFMGLEKKQQIESQIDMLVDKVGKLCCKIGDLLNIAQDFYRELYNIGIFGKSNGWKTEAIEWFNRSPKVSNESRSLIDKEITVKDLENTLRTVKDSSPGEDGIPYSFYKNYIDILGPHMVNAWEHSLKLGILPVSQRSACITLLPKSGKDRRRIENWRPISLSNCDVKLFTKTLALRLNKVLPEIIHESQAAYVPGRNITENLRTMRITRDITREGKHDTLVISLDVKKAYDSLDHEYLWWALHKYGFSDNFINIIKMLYNNNKAKILINGYKTEDFDIKRGVKQGDALSCGLFIIAMDPLIRSINDNKRIIAPTLFAKKKIKAPKCLAYADDVTILCRNNTESVKEVFNIYGKFTHISGLELNAEKTEIFNTGGNREQIYNITYIDKNIDLKTIDSIKIGGIMFHTDPKIEHQLNVGEKIKKHGRSA